MSNESRDGIVERKFAKFRCNGLIPQLIVNLQTFERVDRVTHYTDISGHYTLYKVLTNLMKKCTTCALPEFIIFSLRKQPLGITLVPGCARLSRRDYTTQMMAV